MTRAVNTYSRTIDHPRLLLHPGPKLPRTPMYRIIRNREGWRARSAIPVFQFSLKAPGIDFINGRPGFDLSRLLRRPALCPPRVLISRMMDAATEIHRRHGLFAREGELTLHQGVHRPGRRSRRSAQDPLVRSYTAYPIHLSSARL